MGVRDVGRGSSKAGALGAGGGARLRVGGAGPGRRRGRPEVGRRPLIAGHAPAAGPGRNGPCRLSPRPGRRAEVGPEGGGQWAAGRGLPEVARPDRSWI